MANSLTKVNSGGINDGSIVNADVKSDAAIALSKLASTPAVLTGSTNNTICTVTGANAIQGEGNLTFDGNNLAQTIDAGGEGVKLTAAGDHYVAFVGDSNRSAAARYCTSFSGKWNGTTIGAFNVVTGADDTNKDDGKLEFSTAASGTETVQMTVDSSGRVLIGSSDGATYSSTSCDDLIVGSTTSGKNDGLTILSNSGQNGSIAFADQSADFQGAISYVHNGDYLRFFAGGSIRARIDSDGLKFGSDSAATTALDDYEEGTWDVTIANGSVHSDYNKLKYTKIGNIVHISGQFRLSSASNDVTITNLPFSVASHTEGEGYTTLPIYSHENNFADSIKYIVAYSSPGSTQLVFRGVIDNDGTHSIDGSDDGYFMVGGSYFAA